MNTGNRIRRVLYLLCVSTLLRFALVAQKPDNLILHFTGLETLEARDSGKTLRVDILKSKGHESILMFWGRPDRTSTRTCREETATEGPHKGPWTVCPLQDFEALTVVSGGPTTALTIANWADFVPIKKILENHENNRTP